MCFVLRQGLHKPWLAANSLCKPGWSCLPLPPQGCCKLLLLCLGLSGINLQWGVNRTAHSAMLVTNDILFWRKGLSSFLWLSWNSPCKTGVASSWRDLPALVSQSVGIIGLLMVFKQVSIISTGEEIHLHHKAPPGVNRCAGQRGLNDKEETTDTRT